MKLFRSILYILAAVLSVFFCIAIYGFGNGVDLGTEVGLYATYVLSFVAVISCLIFPIYSMVQNPKAGFRALMGILVLGVLFLVGYIISGDEITLVYERVNFTSQGLSKLIGGSLYMMYFMIFISILVVLYGELVKLFK